MSPSIHICLRLVIIAVITDGLVITRRSMDIVRQVRRERFQQLLRSGVKTSIARLGISFLGAPGLFSQRHLKLHRDFIPYPATKFIKIGKI